MSASHIRRGSGRAPLPRRTTRGPLDVDDPLSASPSLTASSAEPSSSPLIPSIDSEALSSTPLNASQTLSDDNVSTAPTRVSKDLSFLLDASIYHALSNIDTPPPYRRPLPAAPPANASKDQVMTEITNLLRRCHFLSAAHLAATVLISGLVSPADSAWIFRLLSIRYSALELSGNVLLAAQESKALEDLSSTFYYEDPPSATEIAELDGNGSPRPPKHIMPFDLRLQALKLQGMGFGDSRRAVGALFDLGMECRNHLAQANSEEKLIWIERLNEVGVRVVSALIDMGDLDCASRTLRSMRPEEGSSDTAWTSRMVLLLIKMGQADEAKQLLMASSISEANQGILQAFLDVADGKYDEASTKLSRPTAGMADQTLIAIAKQNLAVAHLYTSNIQKSQQILEQLIDEGYSFQALTINLATLYDLTSDKSKDLKLKLVARIAENTSNSVQRELVNADFKL